MKEFTLANGLTVQLINKSGFKKQFATVMIDFGGVDQQYLFNNELRTLPAGTAHFIEHQLFNKIEGDISHQFSKNGAETNAFTSPSKTAYFFNSTGQLTANLDLLARLVGQPYFQVDSVTRERQIIGQELSLYQDQPDFQLETGLLQQLYGHEHPMAIDIAGTLDSLQQITPEVLYAAYQAYYQPQNMKLCIVADLEGQELTDYFNNSTNLWQQLITAKHSAPLTAIASPVPSPVIQQQVTSSELTNNKWSLGIMTANDASKTAHILQQLDLDLILTTLFGETSPIFQTWRRQGLVDDSFQFQTTLERQYSHFVFTANTDAGATLTQQITQILQQLTVEQLANYAAVQQLMVGNSLFAEDDLGSICLENVELSFYDDSWQEFGTRLRQRTLADSLANVQQLLATSYLRSYSLLGGQDHA